MSTSVVVTCLCGENTESLQLASSLPVTGAACCCNLCRSSTGVLYLSCPSLATRPSTDKLGKYNTSEKLTRYFCQRCGSHMFVHVALHDIWTVCSGVIDRAVGYEQVSRFSLEKLVQLEFVGDTVDGGLAACLAEFDHEPVTIYLQGPDEEAVKLPPDRRSLSQGRGAPPDLTSSAESRLEEGIKHTTLQASCHCRGVTFVVTRPGPESRICASPWPDLLVPYHSGSSANPGDVKWWLRANDSKYLAGTCACRSCRLASGSPIQAWAFIPKANLHLTEGSPITEVPFGTLKQFESSPGCLREFCSVCGATVFWHCRERPELFDVSVGILGAVEGSRAETWLEWWTERVSFKEDALDKNLIETLEGGLQYIKPA